MNNKSLRIINNIVKIIEEAPTNSSGTGGYTSAADSSGPVAGSDPILGFMSKNKKSSVDYRRVPKDKISWVKYIINTKKQNGSTK